MPDHGAGRGDQLAKVQALTDTALTHLDVDDLLAELLVRVRQVLDADTAAILLLEEGSHDLVARAACGIEEEVRENVRIPMGAGFAGRIAETRGPIRLDRVDANTVVNPILWEKGIKVMLGVPLLSANRLLGVLHVGRLEERPFDDADAELLEVVAERVAGATHARLLALEQAAASLLERSLLPTRLPNVPGIEFAARYVPAADRMVGGDWYDVFELPNGRLWIVVGDVAGHGLESAVIMGRLRTAVRAYALLDESPEAVLELVDLKIKHFEIGAFATVVCAVLEPPFERMQLVVAGHPPPVVAAPGRRAALAPVALSPPLGVGHHDGRSSTSIPLANGTVVVFYTDGLIERRGQSLDTGLERLCNATSLDDPQTVVREVLRQMIGTYTPRDDIAIVAVRCTPPSPSPGQPRTATPCISA